MGAPRTSRVDARRPLLEISVGFPSFTSVFAWIRVGFCMCGGVSVSMCRFVVLRPSKCLEQHNATISRHQCYCELLLTIVVLSGARRSGVKEPQAGRRRTSLYSENSARYV